MDLAALLRELGRRGILSCSSRAAGRSTAPSRGRAGRRGGAVRGAQADRRRRRAAHRRRRARERWRTPGAWARFRRGGSAMISSSSGDVLRSLGIDVHRASSKMSGRSRALEPLPSEQALRLTVARALLDDEQALGASLAVDGVCLTVRRGGAARSTPSSGRRRSRAPRSASSRRRAREPRAPAAPRRPARRAHGGRARRRRRAASRRCAARRGRRRDRARAGALLRYVVEKGSIAVDGISLTVNARRRRDASRCRSSRTRRRRRRWRASSAGERVNLEVDMIGKYVEKLRRKGIKR